MSSYSAQARALTLLHGQNENAPGNFEIKPEVGNFQNYLPHSALTLLVLILFKIKSLPLLLILIAALLYLKLSRAFKVKKQALDFEKDFATFLVSLAASLRCGNEPLAALFNSLDMFPENSAVYQSIFKAREEAEKGESETVIINNFAADIAHPELALFRSSFLLARSEGGSLATCLERLAKVVRTRQSVRRKIKAAVAMQKLSGYGICAVVLALLVFQSITSREQLLTAWNHPLGGKLIAGSAILVLSGFTWMLSLTRSKV